MLDTVDSQVQDKGVRRFFCQKISLTSAYQFHLTINTQNILSKKYQMF